MNNIFEKINNLKLEKSKNCKLGKFCRAFLEKNSTLTEELFPYLKQLIKDIKFQNEILKLNEAERKLKITTFDDLLKEINDLESSSLYILKNEYECINNNEDNGYISDNYTFYFLGDILYNNYLSIKVNSEKLEQKYASKVYNEYKKINIELDKIDQQYSKYKLLSKNEYITICNDKDSQTIQDSRIGKYFWIEVKRKLLFSIEELISNEYINDIAFRIDNISKYISFMEDMERGSKLDIDVSTLPKLSKFYSNKNYDNQLYISHDVQKGSLTFEELLDDFEIFNNDIVTQVVHLEYKSINGEFFISHLDHEYIIYTFDEYSDKVSNYEKKGHKKVKTFKIDNSSIPFMYKFNNEFFLYIVLDTYFKNKDLISEYFDNVIKESARDE